jgi:hypothetical protein
MSGDIGVGKLLKHEQGRDAIHVAVLVVKTGERLQPGERVRVADGVAFSNAHGPGIIDPFLPESVGKGKKCWMFLNPGSISSLRHDWTHPQIVERTKDEILEEDTAAAQALSARKEAAMDRLRTHAAQCGKSYDHLVETVAEALDSGSGHGGDDAQANYMNNNAKELLDDVALVLDRKPHAAPGDVYFSCTC